MSDCYHLMMCISAKKLADAMKSHEALLLPALYRDFVHNIEQHYEDLTGSEEVPYETIPGTRWLLAQLHSLFGNLLRVESNIEGLAHFCSIGIVIWSMLYP